MAEKGGDQAPSRSQVDAERRTSCFNVSKQVYCHPEDNLAFLDSRCTLATLGLLACTAIRDLDGPYARIRFHAANRQGR